MSHWQRNKMIEEIELRGLDPKTKKGYVKSMELFAEFFPDRVLDELDVTALKTYQLYLLKERDLAPNSVNKEMSGVMFYYRCVLGRPGYRELLPSVKATKRVPTVVTEEEVAAMIDSINSVFYKAVVMLMYSSGLRNEEVRNLKTSDIDSKRMVINVRDGKGKRDRLALLSELALRCLRTYWRLFRLPRERTSDWLFVAAKSDRTKPERPLCHTALGYIIRRAAEAGGIKKTSLLTCCVIPSPSTLSNAA